MRAGRDEKFIGADVFAVDGDFIGRQEVRSACKSIDALGFIKFPVASRTGAFDSQVFPSADTWIIIAEGVRAQAEPRAVASFVVELRGVQQGFHRDIAIIWRITAKRIRLDDGDTFAFAGSDRRGRRAASAAANHDEVIVESVFFAIRWSPYMICLWCLYKYAASG